MFAVEREFVQYCQTHLSLEEAKLPEEYFYQSLPLCVIDAVFSIGVNYRSTQNTVKRFCELFELKQYRNEGIPFPPEQLSVHQFLDMIENMDDDYLADKVFQNRQRTSATNGILKAKAVRQFCQVLFDFGVDYLQHVNEIIDDQDFEAAIAGIPGQGSGISTSYFYMLAGSDQHIKPDRMVLRFIEQATGQKLNLEQSIDLIRRCCRNLQSDYPELTPRSLDYLIWQYQRKEMPSSERELLRVTEGKDGIVLNCDYSHLNQLSPKARDQLIGNLNELISSLH